MPKRKVTMKYTKSAGKPKRPCNLCGTSFAMETKFMRFCNRCKLENQDYLDSGDTTHYVVFELDKPNKM